MAPLKKRQRRGSSEFDEYAECFDLSDDELLELEAETSAPSAPEPSRLKSESTQMTRNSSTRSEPSKETYYGTTQTQKKEKSQTSPKITSKKKRGIDTFFPNSQAVATLGSSQGKSSNKNNGARTPNTRRRKGKLPKDEDENDYVDDIVISSDEDGWSFSATQSPQKSESEPRKTDSIRTTGKMLDPGNVHLPWQYKYAPKSTEELAVNKSKVQQVRKWLEDVFHGTSKRRLLILTGPAGAGKTATLECLSKELGFDLLEWRNPTTNADGLHGSDLGGYSSLFEEFLARAGKWNCLEIFRSDGKEISETDASTGNGRKVIVIEDFPNTLTPSSAPLLAFQHSVKSFLALPPELNPSPLVLIISESARVAGSNAFTAFRLLGPAVLNSYLVSEIRFQPIAKTFMVKALENVIHKESKDSGRRWGPSRPIIEKIGEIGDIRSAIASLEFMSVTGDDAWVGETRIGTKTKTKRANTEINGQYATLLEQVTQRESYLSIFHAVGKVVYNKRYGDDVNDPYQPPPPEPPLPHQRYHRRASVSSPHKILAELTTEIPTFIAALHQNYVLSCGAGEEINDCIDALSDADLLLPQDQWGESAIHQEEMAFEYAVRGLHLGLPSPVRRAPHDVKLFYPSSCKLWRKTEENEGIISMVCNKLLKEDPVSLSSMFGQLVFTTQTIPYALKVFENRKFRSQARPSAQQEILVQAMRKYSRFGQVLQPSEDPDEEPTGAEEEEGTAYRDLSLALAGANLDVYRTDIGKAGGELSEDEIVDSD